MNEYIGNGNDAVDYTSYNMQLETSLYKYRKNIFTSIYSNHDNTVEILNSLEKYPDIEVYKENENSVTYSLYIKNIRITDSTKPIIPYRRNPILNTLLEEPRKG